MSAFQAASIYGVLTLKDSQYNSSLDAAKRKADTFGGQLGDALKRAGDKLDAFGGRASSLGRDLGILFSPMAAFGVAGINAASKFESAMKEISARTGLVGADLERVRQYALEMGGTTSFSAQQAADAFLQLLSSGSSVEEAISTLPNVLDLAAASGMDLGYTADLLTDVLKQFGAGVTKIPANFTGMQQAFGVTDEMIQRYVDGWETSTPQLDSFSKALGASGDQIFEMWSLLQPMTDELWNMGKGISAADWEAYGRDVRNITPEIYDLINTAGIAGDRMFELFTGDAPSWFKSELMDAATVADILAKAAGSSSATVGDLAQGFSNVGPVANMFGISIEDTAAALATLSENGIKGVAGGTALKSMLINLNRPTKEVGKALKELDMSLYNSDGTFKNIDVILKELKGRMEDLPMEDQIRLSTALGGSFGVVALQALLNSNGISDMVDSMGDAAGASAVANARMQGFAGALEEASGAAETLMIEALTPLMTNALTPLLKEHITPLIMRITDWTRENPHLVAQLAMLTVAGMGLSTALIVIGAVASGASAALGLLAVGMSLISAPVLLAAGSLWALSRAWADNIGGMRAGVTMVRNRLGVLTNTIKKRLGDISIGETMVRDIASNISGGLRGAIDRAIGTINEERTFSRLGIRIASGIDRITRSIETLSFTSIGRNLSERLESAFRTISENANLSTISKSISRAIESTFQTAIGSVDMGSIQAWFKDNLETISSVLVAVAGAVFGGPIGIASAIYKAISEDFLGIGTLLRDANIPQVIEGAFNTVKGEIERIFSGGVTLPESGFLARLRDDISGAIEKISDVAGGIKDRVGEGLKALGEGIAAFLTSITSISPDALYSFVRPFGAAIGGLIIGAAGLAGVGAEAVLKGIGAAFELLGQGIHDLVTSGGALMNGDIVTALSNLSVPGFIAGLVAVSLALPLAASGIAALKTAVLGFATGTLGQILIGLAGLGILTEGLNSGNLNQVALGITAMSAAFVLYIGPSRLATAATWAAHAAWLAGTFVIGTFNGLVGLATGVGLALYTPAAWLASGATWAVSAAWGAAAGAVGLFKGALTVLLGPVGVIALAIAGLIALLIDVERRFGVFEKAWNTWGFAIQRVVDPQGYATAEQAYKQQTPAYQEFMASQNRTTGPVQRDVPRFRIGKALVPRDNYPALLHKDERVLTASQNREYRAGGSDGVTIGNVTIHANSYEEGRRAAKGFGETLGEIYRAKAVR